MNILGINSFFEHPSAAIILDGKLSSAVEEERVTGIKGGKKYSPYATYIPLNSIVNALEASEITSDKIDAIAYSYSPNLHLWSSFGAFFGKRLSSFRQEVQAYQTARNTPNALFESIISKNHECIININNLKEKPFYFFDHHLCHAASSYCCSNFTDALVVVIDGSGELFCTSIYKVTNQKITRIGGQNLPNSLGFLYSFVTDHLGFDSFQDEFKVMGLAAYGQPKYLTEFSKIISCSKDGNYLVNKNVLKDLTSILGGKRKSTDEIKDIHADIASSLQKTFEDVVLHILQYYKNKTRISHLCLAGGSFLNCVCNGKIMASGLFEDVFIQPASDDSGTAIGAASLVNYRLTGYLKQLDYENFYLGKQYSDSSILKLLQEAKINYKEYNDEVKLAEDIAFRLHNGEIGGIFRGRMEFGPRALGNRSILSKATSPEDIDTVNQIKGREKFRPVAPVIKADKSSEYFIGKMSEYMTITAYATDRAKTFIPAAVHTDGTARVQLVTEKSNRFLYLILDKYEALSGIPAIINTSLNFRGKPIIENPNDCIGYFFQSSLDFQVCGKYMIVK